MLTITLKGRELFDEESSTFISVPTMTLTFEHSLKSLSEWEEKWKVPFMSEKNKTEEQALDYIRCMCQQDIDTKILLALSADDMQQIKEYIEDSHTATWFREDKPQKRSQSVTTAEIIYYWMTAAQIPFEAEHWHLNKLITLIRVAGEKNAPKKKMSKSENYARHRSLNQSRRAAAAKKP